MGTLEQPPGMKTLARLFLEQGQSFGSLLPWHASKNFYHWLVAESLLRRTTRTAARKAFQTLIEAYPTWQALAAAPEEEIARKIAWTGLGNQRSKHLKALARSLIERGGENPPCTREALLKLPGVGHYIADAVLLYACGKKAFPIDSNVQRVFRRVMGLPVPKGTRHSDPYLDPLVKAAVEKIMRLHSQATLVHIHRGILRIVWETCRPRPNCASCALHPSWPLPEWHSVKPETESKSRRC